MLGVYEVKVKAQILNKPDVQLTYVFIKDPCYYLLDSTSDTTETELINGLFKYNHSYRIALPNLSPSTAGCFLTISHNEVRLADHSATLG